jgi:hypothetical protein
MDLVSHINHTTLMDSVKLIGSYLSERKEHSKCILMCVTRQSVFLFGRRRLVFDSLRHIFLKVALRIRNVTAEAAPKASASTAMTSSRKYWYQARSSAAERK